jgi:repressor LexA
MGLTKRKKRIMDFIIDHLEQYSYPPSIREIMEGSGLKSTSSVHRYLKILDEMGYIKKSDSKTRAIEILKDSDGKPYDPNESLNVATVPLVGQVTAGAPILATENIEEMMPVPMQFVGPGEHFMLRIKGMSMVNAGIHDRDYVLIHRQDHANNGDFVVALIAESATVKTYYKETDRIRLQPENDSMSPIYVDDVKILGVVKGVFRKL